MPSQLTPRRSLLFTPANRPALYPKALASGADIVCIDLEDAVAADQKGDARAGAIAFLSAGGEVPERVLRINSPETPAGREDLSALAGASLGRGIILIPKVGGIGAVQAVAERLNKTAGGIRIAAMIETIAGVENINDIVKAAPRLDFVMFGGADLSAELGVHVEPEPLAYGRSRLVYAARQAGIDVLDMPCLNFQDQGAVEREAAYARRLGFTGKAAIHPSNIPLVNTAFTPTPAELEQARRVIAAYESSTTGVAVLDGALVEIPVVRAMEILLARGRAAGMLPDDS